MENEESQKNSEFSRLRENVRQRNYRHAVDPIDSGEEAQETFQNLEEEVNMDLEESQDSIWATSNTTEELEHHEHDIALDGLDNVDDLFTAEQRISTSSDRESSVADGNTETDSEEIPFALTKAKPAHKWNVIKELQTRNLGMPSHLSLENYFNFRCYGSLRFVQRLELGYKMDFHNGCVNALHFNSCGSKLASGSDDLNIVIWDWAKGEPILNYDSGHRGNVFQVKFLPLNGDIHIVSCARDGHIRIAELSSSGVCHSTRRLAVHKGPAHKLALLSDTPHVFLSAGEDAVVMEIDVRQSKPNKLLTAKSGDIKVALYSINSHPLDSNEFCVGGRDQYVRIYDRRRVSESETPFKKYCPIHLLDSSVRAHVTCAVYNQDGSEVLATYNDEDIYLFDTRHSDVANFVHRYQGHRNNATVKGVNFYGPNSEFVVSGSDCGNIFFWDKDTEAIVQCVPGDENGVVNCLEPHPSVPVLATSGLDDDVKIWIPKNPDEPLLKDLKLTVKTNQRERDEERRREPDTIDGEMLWILWRHIRRTERRRRQQQQQQNRSAGQEPADRHRMSSSSDDSEESEGEDSPRGVQCAPS